MVYKKLQNKKMKTIIIKGLYHCNELKLELRQKISNYFNRGEFQF